MKKLLINLVEKFVRIQKKFEELLNRPTPLESPNPPCAETPLQTNSGRSPNDENVIGNLKKEKPPFSEAILCRSTQS